MRLVHSLSTWELCARSTLASLVTILYSGTKSVSPRSGNVDMRHSLVEGRADKFDRVYL
ncbi:hypothetical protein SCLCIDRAFT_1219818 [Scleroderma citrinum Foug A]|uniref:Uncharacterized protein n=1 Tax=Scleroderma citrinum Foug A TaxID=1036808 RepID=A0A0C2ZWZ7_9AGAM|nr:hypothetical protein SCLCIDRAFT_1219818 [Scleroderma citrinum Foug A]